MPELMQTTCEKIEDTLKIATCFIIALPTALMTPMATLGIDFSETKDFQDLRAALSEKSWEHLAFATLTFIGAQHTLFSLNQLFLFKAFATMNNFFVASYKNICNREKTTVLLLGWLSFLWCVLTSLIFGENGKDTLEFMPGGAITGYILSFIVHFVTRNESVFNELHIKEQLIPSSTPSPTPPANAPYEKTPILQVIATLLVIASLPTVGFCYSPGLVQGFNTLFETAIGEHSHYRDPISIGLSLFALLPTLAFYLKAIYGCPKALRDTLLVIEQKTGADRWIVALQFAFDLFSAIVTAWGYQLIGQSAVDSFKINDPIIKSVAPPLLVGCISTMLTTYLFSIRKSRLAPQNTPENARLIESESPAINTNSPFRQV